jgi:hypothetical protein
MRCTVNAVHRVHDAIQEFLWCHRKCISGGGQRVSGSAKGVDVASEISQSDWGEKRGRTLRFVYFPLTPDWAANLLLRMRSISISCWLLTGGACEDAYEDHDESVSDDMLARER